MSKCFYYLTNNEIDRERWDQCAMNAYNSRIFALSWYLDIFCKGWECITNSDYSIIFPLQVKRKKFVNFISLPMILQQSGPYSIDPLTDNVLNEIIGSIPSKFKYIEYRLTEECSTFEIPGTILKNNCKLKLDLSYEKLFANYTKIHRKNVRRSQRNGLLVNSEIDSDILLNMIIDNRVRGGVRGLTEIDYKQMKLLFDTATEKREGVYKAVYTKQGELCAGAFVIISHPVVTLFFGSTQTGRSEKAVFFLIDHIINQFSGQKRILDFSGSAIKSIADFFIGFGAENFSYPILKINKLPFPLRIFKS